MFEECRIIVVNNTSDVIDTLKSFGYEERSGSPSYKRTSICIVPKKKWFWKSNESLGNYIKQL
jgi:hypothetical protein